MKNERICSVSDCNTRHYARDYCRNHYLQDRRGTLGRIPSVKGECECGEPTFSNGMCKRHYATWWYYTGPQKSRKRRTWVTYVGAHFRVRSERGRAKEHLCIDCENPAEQWSLNHDAEYEVSIQGPRVGSHYSLDPQDYDPRCRPCHDAYDVGTHNYRTAS